MSLSLCYNNGPLIKECHCLYHSRTERRESSQNNQGKKKNARQVSVSFFLFKPNPSTCRISSSVALSLTPSARDTADSDSYTHCYSLTTNSCLPTHSLGPSYTYCCQDTLRHHEYLILLHCCLNKMRRRRCTQTHEDWLFARYQFKPTATPRMATGSMTLNTRVLALTSLVGAAALEVVSVTGAESPPCVCCVRVVVAE